MHTLRYEPISAAFYKTTRDQLAAQLPAGSLVIVHSNDIYPTNADGTLPHHQNANLFYLTGIDQEESVLLMRVQEDGKHEDTLLLRETNEHIVIWEGARLTKEDATALSGIDDVRWTDEYNALLAAWVPAAKKCGWSAIIIPAASLMCRPAMSAWLLLCWQHTLMWNCRAFMTFWRYALGEIRGRDCSAARGLPHNR